jgi:hypothetical protein
MWKACGLKACGSPVNARMHITIRARTPKMIIVIAFAKDSDFEMNREFDERDCHSTFA